MKELVTSFAARATTIALVSFYFMGWAYVRFYYAFFGLSMNVMEVPIYSVFTYSINVFVHPAALGPKMACVVVAGASLAIAWRYPSARRSVAIFLIVAALPALRLVAYVSAQEIAAMQVRRDLYQSIELVLTGGVAQPAFGDANASGRLRLITQTRSHYYLLEWVDRLARVPRDLTVYEIPKRHVVQARILAPGLRPGPR